MSYRKLSKRELVERGLSEKSERYISTDGTIISKRQYQKIQRGGLTYTAFRKQKSAPRTKGPTTRASRVKLHGGVYKSTYTNLTIKQANTILARNAHKRAQVIIGVPANVVEAQRYKETISEDGYSYRTSTPLSTANLARKNLVSDINDALEEIDMTVANDPGIKITVVLYTYPKK